MRLRGDDKLALAQKKIAVLMESDFYEKEIFYYEHRFPEEGYELHFMTRLWGQPSITFTGHEYKAPFEVHESNAMILELATGSLTGVTGTVEYPREWWGTMP